MVFNATRYDYYLYFYNCAIFRGSISIPAFEKITAQEAAAASAAEASADKLKDIINRREEERSSADEEDSNYEHMEWNTMPDFVDRVSIISNLKVIEKC